LDDITFLYDQLIESTARLHAFSSTGNLRRINNHDVEDDVDAMIVLLARRDLLVFAASARNFAEACKASVEMRKIAVNTCIPLDPPQPPFFKETTSSISLYQALSRIIHSIELQVLQKDHDYALLVKTLDEVLHWIDSRRFRERERSEPTILVKTEQDGSTLLRLGTLLSCTCDFLNPVLDRLAKEGRHFLKREDRSLW
jgi:hypothetical protein